ncbi:host specificity factor TipJ family phage tail protein [Pseudomonas sp. NBRC 111132]|uniref:host specificity factor TipJ family phage tail protein n=1 Tax=Pseudomonas sp. NBRC 111132 TaxID=1661047 RepID=UPI0007616D08|nr:host specificity factor TipJ family phage tail protein [Pseudomonas sp. NBRC 111132]
MIEFFANKLDPQPLQRYPVKRETTLDAWLRGNVANYRRNRRRIRRGELQPVSVTVNGDLVHVSAWRVTDIGPDDDVRIWREPKGVDPITITIATIKAAQAVFKLFMPRIKMPNTQGARQGDPLESSRTKANQVRYGDIIREAFGRNKIYPDYIVPQRRSFPTERTEWVQMLLAIGVGEFDIQASDIMIGDTPIISLGSNARYKIYGPGESVALDPAAQWWYAVSEVGATSTGTAGIDLRTTVPATPAAAAQAYQFDGDLVAVPEGAGALPDDWAAGMLLRVEVMYPYEVTAGTGVGGRDTITGPLGQLGAFPGMVIEVVGANEGRYIVNDFTPSTLTEPAAMTLNTTDGAPVSGLQYGTGWACIGYNGLRYRISAANTAQIALERLTDTGDADEDWPGFDYIESNSASLRLDSSTLEGDWAGSFAGCPVGELASTIEVDVMFPQGLASVDKKGRVNEMYVTFEVQYRDIATAGAWSSYSETITRNTLDQIAFTRAIALPYPMRPEVRMRRIGAKSSDTNVQDTIQWYGLRSRLPSPASYPGITTISVAVAGGGRLGAQSENRVSVVGTRILPTREDGHWTEKRPVRDLVAPFCYVAKKVGYEDADLDLMEIDALATVWKARGDTFDFQYDSASTVKEVLGDILAAGFSELTTGRGRLRPVRDGLREGVDHNYTTPAADGEVWAYSAQSMTGSLSRAFTSPAPDDNDGVDCEYIDSRTFQKQVVKCRLPGDQGRRAEKVSAIGITDRDKAYQHGMRRRSEQRYRRWTYSFDTELSANNSDYLSLAGVSDDTPGSGQSTLLKSFSADADGVVLECFDPIDWESMPMAQVALRKQDGRIDGPWSATRIDDYRMRVPQIGFTPDVSWEREPPHLLFGRIHPVLVTSVDPKGLESCSTKGVNYDDRVYLFDSALAPADA